jgi:decaprenylphospho-beta-D-ribofuranose 2-oxidase
LLDLQDLSEIGPIDQSTGEVTCGAGVSVDQLLRHAVPRGWFVPVTPGTRIVSLGGAVAADVHGKNHHRDGRLGAHLTELDIVDGLGVQHRIRPGEPAYDAVVGGLGLAAAVTSVRMRLLPVATAWMRVDTTRTRDLSETMAALEQADREHRYSVAWLDCLATGVRSGRGVVTSGDHASAAEIPSRAVDPFAFEPTVRMGAPTLVPPSVLGPRRVAAFNEAYFRLSPRRRIGQVVPLAGFFHPLDGVRDWNRLYGRDGFVQYQFAGPDPALVQTVLELLQRDRAPAFLAVLKRFGPAGPAPLSFPMTGWTLAVDLPADPTLAPLLDRLDRSVADTGGRVYLAKDARLRPELLASMYPEVGRWRELRSTLDPNNVFRSDLARRLHL